MATDWDPSRDYDSQTFSEDYNLHGASNRSLDHPSISRDEHFYRALNLNGAGEEQEDDSIDNADLDLITNIVDGKASQQNGRYQRAPLRGGGDENSETSIMRYLRDGSHDPIDSEESPDFAPIRYYNGTPHTDQQTPLADEANEDHFRDWSGSTPKQQQLKSMNQRNTPKASPTVKRTMIPTRQTSGSIPKPAAHVRTVSIDEGFKSPASRFGTPIRSGLTPAPAPTAAQAQPQTISAPGPVQPTPSLKPIFRSAMKTTNSINSINGTQQAKSKLGRHIQLPTEILDDDDDEEEDESELPTLESNRLGSDKQYSGQVEQQPSDEEENPARIEVIPTTPVPVPGPSRFMRITKKNVSPAKKSIATIPTPQDDGNEQVQKNVKELKEMLRHLGLMPITPTLESSLDGLDTVTIEKGGLCEMLALLQKLGGMYEKQKEVIHQMTDQIIAGETQRPQQDSDVEERMHGIARQLEGTKSELSDALARNHLLELESEAMSKELERLHTAQEESTESIELTKAKKILLDVESQVSGNWGSIEELLDQRVEEFKTVRSKKPSQKDQQQQSDPNPVQWRVHILKVEQELDALKATLSASSTSGMVTSDMEELEDQLNEALLHNRRLKLKNKSLTKELLNLHEGDSAEDQKGKGSKYRSLLKDVMTRLGVESQGEIIPALNEIERIVRDLPNLRRFIAKAERIIWESEILEGSVRVQKYTRNGLDSVEGGSGMALREEQGLLASTKSEQRGIKASRTCSQSYEETLQRLKEWSELMDVLNHVEFADDLEDTLAASPPS